MALTSYRTEVKSLTTLRMLAWIWLITGLAAGITSWVNWGIKVKGFAYSRLETDPLGISLGLLSILLGVVGCAFLLVICEVAEAVMEIRNEIIMPRPERNRDAESIATQVE